MARNENQKQKLLIIKDFLEKKTDDEHGVTINDLIEELNRHDIAAERKSLYNDIDTLIDYGMDILKEKKDRKTYYKLVSRKFELPELKLLVDAVQSSKFITANKTEKLIKKIETLTSEEQAKELQRQVYILNRVKNQNERIYLNVDALHKAIHNKVSVTFKYTYWNTKKQLVPKHDGKLYRVSPWGLVWDDENYYLVGFDEESQKIKHYRVDKMLNLAETGEPINASKETESFNPATYSNKMFGMYGGKEQNVKLRVANNLVGVIIDRFGSDVMIHPENGKDTFTVNLSIEVSRQFLGWLIGLGDEIEVVEPATVRDELASVARELSKKYL